LQSRSQPMLNWWKAARGRTCLCASDCKCGKGGDRSDELPGNPILASNPLKARNRRWLFRKWQVLQRASVTLVILYTFPFSCRISDVAISISGCDGGGGDLLGNASHPLLPLPSQTAPLAQQAPSRQPGARRLRQR
jgi:hypothetical protein